MYSQSSADYQSRTRGFSPLFRGLYSDQHLRVSDAERQEVADRLAEHFADGRLDQAEFDDRVGRAMGAKTRADLGGLFSDLPETGAPAVPEHPRPAAPSPGSAAWSCSSSSPRCRPALWWTAVPVLWLAFLVVGHAARHPDRRPCPASQPRPMNFDLAIAWSNGPAGATRRCGGTGQRGAVDRGRRDGRTASAVVRRRRDGRQIQPRSGGRRDGRAVQPVLGGGGMAEQESSRGRGRRDG